MFTLAPFTPRPAVHAVRRDHGPFLNTIITHVDRLLTEKDVVGMENRKAKNLFNAMDLFFSYGMLSGDSNYWSFVKQFLPRTEQEMLRAEWGDGNGRKLSLAWLKDAFNKGSLGFQMLGFRMNKKIALRFYHKNAFINNGGMLEAVTNVIDKLLSTVQFSFYTSLRPRREEQAVVVEHRTVKNSAKNKVTRVPVNESQPVIRNIVVPPTTDMLPGTPVDSDSVLENFIWRRNRYNSRHNLDSAEEEATPTPACETQSIVVPRSLMSNKLSEVDIAHRDPKPVDQLFDQLDLKDSHEDDDVPIEGEEIVNSGDLLQLAVNIFADEGERLLRMYNIYETFKEGAPVKRLLAISDYNMYLLSKAHSHNPADFAEERYSADISFFVHTLVPLVSIASIEDGLNHQWITILASKDGKGFTKFENDRASVVPNPEGIACSSVCITAGDSNLGQDIMNTIRQACSLRSLSVEFITDPTPYLVVLKRFVSRECCASSSSEVQHYSLVFWKETSASPDIQEFEHSGYLNWRFVVPAWFRKSTESKQNYVLLQRDRKLYVFKDISMKEGVAVYDLRKCLETTELDCKRDMQWSFDLVFPDGRFQIISSSKEDLLKWMLLIRRALTSEDESPAASMLLLTETHAFLCQEGTRFLFDGFMRSLVTFALSDIKYGWIVRGEPHMAVMLRINENFQWLFFRTECELDNFLRHVKKYPIKIDEILSKSQSRETAFIISECARSPDLWAKHIQDRDAEEVFAN